VPFFGWRDEVVQRMASYKEPWFMLLHIWEVHRPFRSPPDFTKQFDRKGYEASVSASDDYLAPVFEAAGDNSVLVFTGDHGEEYPDTAFQQKVNRVARIARRKLKPSKWWPYLDKKLSAQAVGHGFALHEHLIRVPLILSGPGVPQVQVEDQVRHVDLFPTLADLFGLEPPSGADGRSLKPLMQGGTLAEAPAYMEAVGVKLEGKRIAGARIPDWKLLKPGGGKPQLFKLTGASPPDEKHSHHKRNPEVARRLETFIDEVEASAVVAESGMTQDEEAIIEQNHRDLGYL
jgi:arylsulfatase A-like enzyme